MTTHAQPEPESEPESEPDAGPTPTDSGNPEPGEPRLRRVAVWMLIGVVIAACVGGLCSLLPPRLRLLGVFAVAEGVVAGLCLQRLAFSLKLHYPRAAACGGFLVGVAAFAATSGLWWQAWSQNLSDRPDPEAALAMRMLAKMEEPEDATPEEIQAYREHRDSLERLIEDARERRQRDFRTWLVHRSSAVTSSMPLAVTLWGVELVLAGLVSGWISRQAGRRRFCPECQSWQETIREHTFTTPLPDRLRELLRPEESAAQTVVVQFSNCRCPGRRPDVRFSTPEARGRTARREQASDADAGFSDEEFEQLKAVMDDAQGMG